MISGVLFIGYGVDVIRFMFRFHFNLLFLVFCGVCLIGLWCRFYGVCSIGYGVCFIGYGVCSIVYDACFICYGYGVCFIGNGYGVFFIGYGCGFCIVGYGFTRPSQR